MNFQEIHETWLRQGQQRRVSQHYVSRFYLRGFADENGRLSVLDRASGRIRTLSTKRAGAQDHFYTVETAEGSEDFTVEAMLGWLEDRAAPPIRKLLAAEVVDSRNTGRQPPRARKLGRTELLDEEERENLLAFLTFQIVRGPDHRAIHIQLADYWAKMQAASWPKDPAGMKAFLREALGSEPTDDQVAEVLELAAHPEKWEVEPHQNESIRLMLETAEELYPALAVRYMSVVESDEPVLVTSDRPVHRWTKKTPENTFFGTGLANADEVRFPLGAQRMLILSLDGPELIGLLDPEVARDLNRVTASWSHDSVFARLGNEQLEDLADLIRGQRRPGIEIVDGGRRVLPK